MLVGGVFVAIAVYAVQWPVGFLMGRSHHANRPGRHLLDSLLLCF